MIEVNPNSTLQVLSVGEENTPVIIIDDFATDTRDAIDYACESAEFGGDTTSAYPGLRAPLDRDHVIAELNALYPLLCKVYRIPGHHRMRPVNTVYSVISTAPGDLKLLQRLPHFDSNEPYYFAITHYLAPGEFGGTGLYRHRPTGFECITEARLSTYIEAGDAFLDEHGEPKNEYFGPSDEHYELYYTIDYKPNRLVAYPGYLLHSGLVDPDRDIDPDPRTGRLTTNVCVNFKMSK